MHWRKVALVGVGMLGGSLGMALKHRGLADHVTGYVRRLASRRECLQHGAADKATLDLAEAVEGADLVVFCTPLSQMTPLAREMQPALSKNAIITDVGSVKAVVVDELESIFSNQSAHFVGSHPMAGGERTGVAAAREDLFEGAVCVVTPTQATSPDALAKVESLWTLVGGRVRRMSPAHHDEYAGRASHLPHVVAAALVNYVLSPAHPQEQRTLCASGFRDTTRIASGSPDMWRDIALANRDHLMRSLGVFIEDLSAFKDAMESGDPESLREFFNLAKQRRDEWCARSTPPGAATESNS